MGVPHDKLFDYLACRCNPEQAKEVRRSLYDPRSDEAQTLSAIQMVARSITDSMLVLNSPQASPLSVVSHSCEKQCRFCDAKLLDEVELELRLCCDCYADLGVSPGPKPKPNSSEAPGQLRTYRAS